MVSLNKKSSFFRRIIYSKLFITALAVAAASDKEAPREKSNALDPQKSVLPRLIIEHIQVSYGRIDFIDRPDGRFIIREDLALNIRDAIKKEGKENPGSDRMEADKSQPKASLGSKKEPSQKFPIKIKHVQVKDGKLAYADLSLKPRFVVDIHNLNGMIVGLSTDPAGTVALQLKGRVGQYGSADIKGELKPFNLRSHSDVKLLFNNMEMTDLTPYSAKFAGRKIDSGKMSAEIDYQIRKSRLQGKNRVVIDNLLLGRRVENSSAPHLPLDLALALLKDSNGRIDLDLPVTGDLDHPEFSYGHLIWKAIVNVVKKIVTTPIRAIGKLLGIKHEEQKRHRGVGKTGTYHT